MITAYLILSALVLLLIVSRCPIFSSLYLFLLLLVICCLVLLPLYHPVLFSLVVLALLLPLFRLLYLIVKEIKRVSLVMGKTRFFRAFAKTILLWLPFPILAIAGYWLLAVRDHHVYQRVDAFVYESHVDSLMYGCGDEFNLVCRCQNLLIEPTQITHLSANDCPVVSSGFYQIKPTAGTMERDIHSAIERLKLVFRDDIVSRLERELDTSQTTIQAYNGNIELALFGRGERRKDSPIIAYQLADYHPDLQPPECNGVIDQLFKLRQCVKNIALEPLSTAYRDIREDLRRQAVSVTSDGEQSVEEQLQILKTAVTEIVEQRLNSYSRSAHRSVESSFATLTILDRLTFVAWLVMAIYALLIGFLYVFVRYSYNQQQGKVPFQMITDQQHPLMHDKHPLNTIAVNDITIDSAMNSFSVPIDKQTWYAVIDASLRYEVDGIICLPRPLTLLFKRLPKRYLMFRYRSKEGKSTISAHADGLTRFLKITLQPGQSVCFECDNLVAFSDDVELKATLNLPLTAFFQDQLFFSTAEGPGELIIRAKSGNPEIMPQDGVKPSDPRDVILFDLKGSYSLVADLNPLSVYFLGHRVIPDERSTVIRQSPDAKSSFSAQATAVRRTLYLLLPLTFVTIVLPLLLP